MYKFEIIGEVQWAKNWLAIFLTRTHFLEIFLLFSMTIDMA